MPLLPAVPLAPLRTASGQTYTYLRGPEAGCRRRMSHGGQPVLVLSVELQWPSGLSGGDGPAASAQLALTFNVAVDSAGNPALP